MGNLPDDGDRTSAVESDRDKLKIASFRTKEGTWADFIAAAAKVGLTGTDVLKSAMDDFMAGQYVPKVHTGTHTVINTRSITKEEIQALIEDALEQRSFLTRDDVMGIAELEAAKAIAPLQDLAAEVGQLRKGAEFLSDSIGEVMARVNQLERATTSPSGAPSPPVKVMTLAKAPLSEEGRVAFRTFVQMHNLPVERTDKGEVVQNALLTAGLANDWVYKAGDKYFYPLGNMTEQPEETNNV